jgi:hypothetical protein
MPTGAASGRGHDTVAASPSAAPSAPAARRRGRRSQRRTSEGGGTASTRAARLAARLASATMPHDTAAGVAGGWGGGRAGGRERRGPVLRLGCPESPGLIRGPACRQLGVWGVGQCEGVRARPGPTCVRPKHEEDLVQVGVGLVAGGGDEGRARAGSRA